MVCHSPKIRMDKLRKGFDTLKISGHLKIYKVISVQFSSVAQLCPTLCDPMNHSTPGLPVHYQLPEFTQTHIHRVSDAIQPSHPLSSPSPPAPNPSQHQSFPMSQLFSWGGQSTGVSASASVLPKKSQGWSPSEWTGWIFLQSKGLSRVFSNTMSFNICNPYPITHFCYFSFCYISSIYQHMDSQTSNVQSQEVKFTSDYLLFFSKP